MSICPTCTEPRENSSGILRYRTRQECPDCYKAYHVAWREKRRALGLRSRGGAFNADQQREHRKLPEVRKRITERRTAYERRPDVWPRALARRVAYNAFRRGELKRLPCETCGTTKNLHAHHDDYSKPLEVRWLCADHHREHHKIKRALAEGESPEEKPECFVVRR